MPAVATDIDAVSAKGEDGKPQDETVAECPFAHTKHAEATASEFGTETNGNEQNGRDMRAVSGNRSSILHAVQDI